jgi:CubicO group peptidase (beta-lactamase class C family)
LGRIVEIVSGKSFDQFLRTRIFEPLEMKETFFYPSDELTPRLVTSYQKTAKSLERGRVASGFPTIRSELSPRSNMVGPAHIRTP